MIISHLLAIGIYHKTCNFSEAEMSMSEISEMSILSNMHVGEIVGKPNASIMAQLPVAKSSTSV